MELKTLQPATTPENWRLFTSRKADPAFLEFSEQIFARDNDTCQFCGFQAPKYQEIINLDQNYRNNKAANLATACLFCAQCFFLESVGKSDTSGGTVIYLPELTQAEVNGLCHAIFSAIFNEVNTDDAQSVYRTLKLRSKIVEKNLGEGMSNPATLGQLFIDTNIKEQPEVLESFVKDLRLLPSRDKFSKQIREWAMIAPDYGIND